MEKSTMFNNNPFVEVQGFEKQSFEGWETITSEIQEKIVSINKAKKIVVIETYTGVLTEEIINAFQLSFPQALFVNAEKAMKTNEEIDQMIYPDVTDDEVFGFLTRLKIQNFYNHENIEHLQQHIKETKSEHIIIYGTGAYLINLNPDILIHADMSRWEGQLRYRRNEVSNLGADNKELKASLQYKRAFFVDWRVCDKLKKSLYNKWDYILDTIIPNNPKMITKEAFNKALELTVNQPFELVPFFDMAPWGGQWMKDKCNLDKNKDNFGWCFNGVPEENSLLFKFGELVFETPGMNLVFFQAEKLLGEPVHARFGDEFPIRFDFLDTINGGNLSLQVHPLTEYIQEKFGWHYTQDESYYLMEAKEDAEVYLGLKEDINPTAMVEELQHAQDNGTLFDTEKHVQTWKAKKHDHFLIPGGTVHCSGTDCMVLEISATPYIFTFKLYDWGRMGLDGKPRPINIEHGKNVIQWNRTTKWTKKNLVNKIELIETGDGWREEKTGLHEREFIETRRHWFSKKVLHKTKGSVNVLCLVEGEEAVIESPNNLFKPFVVHYAEVFIIPANIKEYTIRPFGKSENKEIATIKAYIRH